MNTLKVEKRNMQTKAKKLRREGFVTGNVFGKEIEGSIPVLMTKKHADELLKTCRKGSQIMMQLDGEEMDVLIKEIDYNPLKHEIMEIDFQKLVKGEMVHSVAEVILLNHDQVAEGIVELVLQEISYKATPESLVETIEIDLSKLRVGDEVKVKDLAIASDKNVNLQTPLEDAVVRIVEPHVAVEEPAEETEESAVEE